MASGIAAFAACVAAVLAAAILVELRQQGNRRERDRWQRDALGREVGRLLLQTDERADALADGRWAIQRGDRDAYDESGRRVAEITREIDDVLHRAELLASVDLVRAGNILLTAQEQHHMAFVEGRESPEVSQRSETAMAVVAARAALVQTAKRDLGLLTRGRLERLSGYVRERAPTVGRRKPAARQVVPRQAPGPQGPGGIAQQPTVQQAGMQQATVAEPIRRRDTA